MKVLVLLLAIATSAISFAQSGLQYSVDGNKVLVSKKVGNEQWSINYDVRDGNVTGIIFFPTQAPPLFVDCVVTGEDDQTLYFSCDGADECRTADCPITDWSFIADVPLPKSFFQPRCGNEVAFSDEVLVKNCSSYSYIPIEITCDDGFDSFIDSRVLAPGELVGYTECAPYDTRVTFDGSTQPGWQEYSYVFFPGETAFFADISDGEVDLFLGGEAFSTPASVKKGGKTTRGLKKGRTSKAPQGERQGNLRKDEKKARPSRK